MGLATVAIAACKFPPPPNVGEDGGADGGRLDALPAVDAPPATFALGGTVSGLWTGAAITLHLAGGGTTEDLAVSAGQPFTFAARLADDSSYLVTVADDGPDHDCVLSNGSGTIRSADVTTLQVTCTNLIPHGIALSIPTTFAFDPRTTRYVLPVSLLQQEVAVTVNGPTLTAVEINGNAATVGQVSAPLTIGQAQTTIPVVVHKGPLSQRYDLVFDRGATPIVEALYARASNAGLLDLFGGAVAADGDYVAIGAVGEDSSSAGVNDDTVSNAGAVYVYRRAGTSWMPTQMLKGSAITAERFFGSSIDIDGDLMVVGARYDDGRARNAGAAYVFRLNTGTGQWIEEQRLTASDPHIDDNFGAAVSVSANRIVVSAPYHDAGQASTSDYGLVYVYTKAGATWTEEARVRATSVQTRDAFGAALALDGDTLVASTGRGTMVKRRSGTTWVDETFPAASGGALALQGDLIAIGFSADASGNGQPGDQSAPWSGAVRVYARSGSSWQETAYLKAAVPVSNAELGVVVALEGNTLVTAARVPQAALFTFHRVGGSWIGSPEVPPSDSPTDESRWASAIALSRYGAVVGGQYDDGVGAGTAPASGTAWFFR